MLTSLAPGRKCLEVTIDNPALPSPFLGDESLEQAERIDPCGGIEPK